VRARHLVAGAAAAGAGLAIACVDLFHSTDFATLCAFDAASDACARPAPPPADGPVTPVDGGPEAAPRPPTDFCKWTSGEARVRAERACAWLGAVAGTLGANELGACVTRATEIYDCSVSPGRNVRPGPMHDYWDCLWQVKSRDDLRGCVLSSPPSCKNAGDYTACASPTVRMRCTAPGAQPAELESCVAKGQVCRELTPTRAECTGTEDRCTSTRCVGEQMHVCVDAGADSGVAGAIDDGTDCATVGAGTCSVTGTSCKPTGTACSPSSVLTCTGGVVSGCPAGVAQTTNCAALSGGACSSNEPGQEDDLARSCKRADAGACGPATCSGPQITACYRGNTVSVVCGDHGLVSCAPGGVTCRAP
jgi:hypothetical protein